MDFDKMSITDLLAVEGEEREAAVAHLNDNFARNVEVETQEEEASSEVSSFDAFNEKLTDLMAVVLKLVPTEAVATEESEESDEDAAEEVDPKDEVIADMREEITASRMETMTELLGEEFLSAEENKAATVAEISEMKAEAFTAHVAQLKAVAKVQEDKIAKAAAEKATASTETKPEPKLSAKNFNFDMSVQEAE